VVSIEDDDAALIVNDLFFQLLCLSFVSWRSANIPDEISFLKARVPSRARATSSDAAFLRPQFRYGFARQHQFRAVPGRRRRHGHGRARLRRRSGCAFFRVHGGHVRPGVLVHGRGVRHREVGGGHRLHGRDAPRARDEVDRPGRDGRGAGDLRTHHRGHNLHEQYVVRHENPQPRFTADRVQTECRRADASSSTSASVVTHARVTHTTPPKNGHVWCGHLCVVTTLCDSVSPMGRSIALKTQKNECSAIT